MLTKQERVIARGHRNKVKHQLKAEKKDSKNQQAAREKACFITNGYHEYTPDYNTVGGVHRCANCGRYWGALKSLFEPSNPKDRLYERTGRP